jgi:transposase-like protein
MLRTRARRTDRSISQEVMEVATAEVTNNGKSVRSVAKQWSMCHASLHRFCVKLRENENGLQTTQYYVCNKKRRRTQKLCEKIF